MNGEYETESANITSFVMTPSPCKYRGGWNPGEDGRGYEGVDLILSSYSAMLEIEMNVLQYPDDYCMAVSED